MIRMATMAMRPPPEMSLGEPDAASTLDAVLVGGEGVGGKVLPLVVGIVIGNEMIGMRVAVVEITNDEVNDKSVESVVTVAGPSNCRVWICRGKESSKAGSADRSPGLSSL